jgi:hypothetical protein
MRSLLIPKRFLSVTPARPRVLVPRLKIALLCSVLLSFGEKRHVFLQALIQVLANQRLALTL